MRCSSVMPTLASSERTLAQLGGRDLPASRRARSTRSRLPGRASESRGRWRGGTSCRLVQFGSRTEFVLRQLRSACSNRCCASLQPRGATPHARRHGYQRGSRSLCGSHRRPPPSGSASGRRGQIVRKRRSRPPRSLTAPASRYAAAATLYEACGPDRAIVSYATCRKEVLKEARIRRLSCERGSDWSRENLLPNQSSETFLKLLHRNSGRPPPSAAAVNVFPSTAASWSA